MAVHEEYVKSVKPYCKKHGLMLGYNPDNETYFCRKCDIETSIDAVEKYCYAPHYFQQKDTQIEYK